MSKQFYPMARKRKHSAAAQPPNPKSPPPPPNPAPVLEVEDSDEEYVEEIEEEEEEEEEEESESDDEGSDSDEEEEGPESESDDEEESESEEEESDDEIRDDDEESVKKEKIRKLLIPFSKDELIAILNEAAKSDTSLIPSLIKTIESNPVHKKLFVYGLAFHVDDAMLASAFSKFGAVESAAVVGETSTGKSKGYGFVVFEDRVAARKAIKEGSLNVGGKVCGFQLSVHGSRAAVGAAAAGDVKTVTTVDEGERKLYVANVRENVDKERLKVFFEQFGEIETGPIGWDRFTGKFKGYALIVYKTVEGLRKALEQPIKMFEGNVFRCSKAISDKSKQGVAGQGGVVAGQNATQGAVPGQNQNPGQGMAAQNVNPGWMGQNPNPTTGVPPQNPGAGTYNPYLGGNEAAVGAAAVSGGMVVSGAGAVVAAGVGAGAGVGMGVTPSFPGAPSAGYFPRANTGSAGFFPGAISAGAYPGAVPAGSFPGAVPAGSYSGVASAGSFLGAAAAGSLPGVASAGWFPGATSTGSFPSASYRGAASVGSFPGAAFPGAASAGSFPGSVAAGSFPGAVSTGPLTGAKSAGLHPSAVSTGTATPVSTSQGATRAHGGTGGINTISPSVIGCYAARVGLQGLGSSAASSGLAGRGQNNAGSSFHPQFNR